MNTTNQTKISVSHRGTPQTNKTPVCHRQKPQTELKAQTATRRLFPNMTVWELSCALENSGALDAEKIRLAIRQRDPLDANFVKPFATPQLTGKFTLKA